MNLAAGVLLLTFIIPVLINENMSMTTLRSVLAVSFGLTLLSCSLLLTFTAHR